MSDITKDQVIDWLSGQSVIEIADLVKELEEKWGVSAAAPAAVAVAAPAGGGGDGDAAGERVEASLADLATQCPDMCALQEMHRPVAASPRTQAIFWLLMDDLVDRYLLAIGQ